MRFDPSLLKTHGASLTHAMEAFLAIGLNKSLRVKKHLAQDLVPGKLTIRAYFEYKTRIFNILLKTGEESMAACPCKLRFAIVTPAHSCPTSALNSCPP